LRKVCKKKERNQGISLIHSYNLYVKSKLEYMTILMRNWNITFRKTHLLRIEVLRF